jgi:hypothetical protein
LELIELTDRMKGRKPPAGVREARATAAEKRLKPYGWAKWWMTIGGFKNANELDWNGWSPLHHAVDATSYSWRAGEATPGLTVLASADTINQQTTGSQPRGFSCLHFACDGSDKNFIRVGIVVGLLDKKADIEARDAKQNTPFLTASGTGVTDVVQLLVTCRADVTAVNDRGAGALNKSRKSSTNVFAALSQVADMPDTEPTKSGRTRTGESDSRLARRVRGAADAAEKRLGAADRGKGKAGKEDKGKGGKAGKEDEGKGGKAGQGKRAKPFVRFFGQNIDQTPRAKKGKKDEGTGGKDKGKGEAPARVYQGIGKGEPKAPPPPHTRKGEPKAPPPPPPRPPIRKGQGKGEPAEPPARPRSGPPEPGRRRQDEAARLELRPGLPPAEMARRATYQM